MNIFNEQEDGKIHIVLGIICFMMPIVGVIFYFIKRNNAPTMANDALMAALFGVILNFILLSVSQ